MIQLLTGKIGAGKTLHAVEFIYEALCEGRFVATNIELNFSKLSLLALKEKGVLLDLSQFVPLDLNKDPDWHKKIPCGVTGKTVLVVLDEVHLFFNSRDYAKTDKLHLSMLSFLSQSWKAAVDVLFVAQVASQVGKQFRAQAQNEIYISCFGNFHLPILGRIPLTQNVLTTRDLDSGAVMRKQKRDYPKKMFGCYETLAFLDTEMQQEFEHRDRQEPLKLRKPSSSEKKEIIIKLNRENEILDNIDTRSWWSSFWPLAFFTKGNGQRSSGGNFTDSSEHTQYPGYWDI